MPIKSLKKLFFGPAPGLTREEAAKIFKRDHFTCQYCGLDGSQVFENWLILTIDHVHPHAHGGTRKLDNLVTACRPCNIIKGTRVFDSKEGARNYVLEKREEWRRQYAEQTKPMAIHAAAH